MPHNIFAYTAPGADFPEFVSVNEADGGGVEFIIRSRIDIGGSTAQVALNHEQAKALYYAMQAHLFDDEQPEPA